MFGICLIIFIGLCIHHASEPTLPADYHRNWKLEQEEANRIISEEIKEDIHNDRDMWGYGEVDDCDIVENVYSSVKGIVLYGIYYYG